MWSQRWIKDKTKDVSQQAGASLRRSLPPKDAGAGAFSTKEIKLRKEIKDTLVDIITNTGQDAEVGTIAFVLWAYP